MSPYQVLLEDLYEGLLNSWSHGRGISTHIDVALLLQQLPDQVTLLPQFVLDIDLLLLQHQLTLLRAAGSCFGG